MGGEEEDARDWAVAEVGRARGRSVTLRPSMLPLFTRDSMSSERSSADSLSTWIILHTHRHIFILQAFVGVGSHSRNSALVSISFIAYNVFYEFALVNLILAYK